MRIAVLGATLAVFAAASAASAAGSDGVAAGRYQAILADCDGCHISPDGKHFAGGLVLATPFGTLVAPNITQDRETGIGRWRLDEFRRAVKQGIGRGGKRLYPAMPYPAYARIGDADITALWAYMKTVAPVRHAVKSNLLRFPFNIRATMLVWNWVNFKPAPFKPDPAKSAAWNRGAYIVTGPGHCGACHTPKSLLGADRSSRALTGASLQDWFAPDITSHRVLGIGGWTEADVVTYLRSGWNAHAAATGPMAEAVENSTSKMTNADLAAIAVYLKDQAAPPREMPPALAATEPQMKSGAAVYQANCVGCHGWDGKGESHVFPPLAGNAIVQQDSVETLARVVLAGARAAQTSEAPTAPAMPSFAWRLSDGEIADMLTYIRNSWGNAAAPVSADFIGKIRARLHGGS